MHSNDAQIFSNMKKADITLTVFKIQIEPAHTPSTHEVHWTVSTLTHSPARMIKSPEW